MLRFAGNEFYDTLCASQTTFPSAGLSDGGIMTITRPKKKKKRKTKEENKEEKEPRFSVILWNDDVHTFEYVIFMLQTLFGYPARKGLMLASEVHVNGRAIVFTSSLNEAEVKRDQILSFGPDILCADSSGPLIATLERTPE
jgi:ATP-dependent Clp protease adaptor protein ClpS